MEMLFGVQRKASTGLNFSLENRCNVSTKCKVSTTNCVAFTTNIEIGDTTNTTWGFHTYVCDINTPWYAYKVTSAAFPVSVLEWDISGKYLLIGDISGSVQIWIQKDNLISEWTQLYAVNFHEHIVRAVFFHNGRKIAMLSDKKDISYYSEKFQRVKFAPSVRQFGGVATEGVLCVTCTGMLGAFVIPNESPLIANIPNSNGVSMTSGPFALPSVTESLGTIRSYVTAADISYGKNGTFMIAVTNGEYESVTSAKINCYRVSIKKQLEKLTITSQALPSFFLCEGAGRDIPDLKVTHLKWASSEDCDSLLVGAKCSAGSFLELWGLVEKSTPIHKLFQNPTKTEVFKFVIWAHQANYRYTSGITDIGTSRFYYGNSAYAFVSMNDNTIHCLHRDTLKRGFVHSASTACVLRNDTEHSSKQMRVDTQITAHDISVMGHLFMSIDSQGQLFAFRVTYPHQDQSANQHSIAQIVTSLEYCLFAGLDPLDIFLSLKVQHLDQIVDRITENFQRQQPAVQQYFYVNFLTLKTNLYRLSIPGQSKAHDLTSLLMLHSILIAFKNLLRPSDLTSHDKGPAENLAMVLAESVPDIDKVLLGLEGKDFTVEKSTLQSLQQLIQFIADLSLNILARLPENRSMGGGTASRNTGYEISKDIVALNSIRELLVMMRIWGLLKPQCLPVFSRSTENMDVLATLFRLLTRLALNPNEPDDVLLDECCVLPSQVLIPQLQFTTSITCVASPVLQFVPLPINLEYNVEPVCLKFCPDVPIIEGGLSSDNMVDSVRHLQLGKRPASVRKCTRCGASSSTCSVARTAAMRAWEQRFHLCRCGGFWRLQTLE